MLGGPDQDDSFQVVLVVSVAMPTRIAATALVRPLRFDCAPVQASPWPLVTCPPRGWATPVNDTRGRNAEPPSPRRQHRPSLAHPLASCQHGNRPVSNQSAQPFPGFVQSYPLHYRFDAWHFSSSSFHFAPSKATSLLLTSPPTPIASPTAMTKPRKSCSSRCCADADAAPGALRFALPPAAVGLLAASLAASFSSSSHA